MLTNHNSTPNALTPEMLVKEATRRQNNAASGLNSVWVSASAGTGKTYVLTKRILGLLLQDNSLKPYEILAVTFTRAAAREMEERLRSELSVWATCTEEELHVNLEKMLGEEPSKMHVKRARTLFAEFLDNAVESNTIHGFCQKILAQFPLEADISPAFNLIEGQEQSELLRKAKSSVFMHALEGTLKPAWVFDFYAYTYGEKTLSEALDSFVNEATRYKKYLRQSGGIEGVKETLLKTLNIEGNITGETYENFCENLCVVPNVYAETLIKGAESLLQGGKVAQGLGTLLKEYLHDETAPWQKLRDVFISPSSGKVRSQGFPDKKAREFGGDDLWDLMYKFADYILDVEEKIKTANAYLITISYLELGSQILESYEKLKYKSGVLDFDDLISKTADLLKNTEKSEWVRFKMDQKIRHVLLDEAQDTDNDQWHILKAIVDEFYAGVGQHEGRTFFAVGDMKQSIYRFRGAQPHVFGSMKHYLHAHQSQSNAPVAVEELMVSFRSTEPVLNFVDSVFQQTNRHHAVDDMADEILHNAVKVGSSGVIHISPLLEAQDDEVVFEPWSLPTRKNKQSSLKEEIAEKTAKQILNLLNSKDVLESTGTYIEPGDIMILLRSRSLMSSLIAALDRYYIPHGGADQVTLQSETVIQDLLALLKFVSNTDDDLSLAHVLRSPLIGLNDEEFDALFVGKKKSKTLWHMIDKTVSYGAVLQNVTRAFYKEGLQGFLTWVIQQLNVRGVYYSLMSMRDEKSPVVAVDDALDTLLNMAMEVTQKGEGVLKLIHMLDTQTLNLKRETDAGNKVRLMTAHGSKGLESPIVIMPDTTGQFYKNMSNDTGLWHVGDDGSDHLFLHRLSAKEVPAYQEKLVDEEKERIFRDEMRLLYVALTRSKERIYISGVKKHGYKPENCWYGHILEAISEQQKFLQITQGEYVFKVENNLTAQSKETPLEPVEEALPEWVESLAPNERGLTLVHASDSLKRKEQLELLSEKQREKLFKRGQLVHKLLEFLPELEQCNWQEKGLNFLNQVAAEYTSAEKEMLVKSAVAVLQNFPEFFAENSKAEIPLAANINGYRLEGIVDRLVVCENEVIAVDYKTNATIPETIPVDYQKQMQFYKKALQEIFPKKEIKAVLIWTASDTPKLNWV